LDSGKGSEGEKNQECLHFRLEQTCHFDLLEVWKKTDILLMVFTQFIAKSKANTVSDIASHLEIVLSTGFTQKVQSQASNFKLKIR
jgi:hypothetical protein